MKTIYLNLVLVLCLLLATTGITFATDIPVAAGANAISTAYASAAAGDVIILTTSGGEYIETATIEITKDITVKAADGLAEKPIIFCLGDQPFHIKSASLNIEGVRITGKLHGTTGAKRAFFCNLDSAVTGINLWVNNCVLDKFLTTSTNYAIYSTDGSQGTMDTISITNTVIDSVNGYAAYLKNTEYTGVLPGGFLYFKWENCLVTNIYGTGITSYIEAGNKDLEQSEVMRVFINHLTVDSAGKRGLYVIGISGAVIQNSIVTNVSLEDSTRYSFYMSNPNYATGWQPNVLKNVIYYNQPSSPNRGASAGDSSITENVQNVDPMYTDPANGDYTLAASSPGKNAATDGSDLGYIPGGIPTSIAPISGLLPKEFNLSQNYPNPFNPSTTIQFSVPKAGLYSLRVYNILGQEVSQLLNKEVSAGNYEVSFNASNLSSGLYFYTLSGNNVNITKKMILLR